MFVQISRIFMAPCRVWEKIAWVRGFRNLYQIYKLLHGHDFLCVLFMNVNEFHKVLVKIWAADLRGPIVMGNYNGERAALLNAHKDQLRIF
jgi:hypothetical protein